MSTWSVKDHLRLARKCFPATDKFLERRAKQINEQMIEKQGLDPDRFPDHLSETGRWSFYEYFEADELKLAWTELQWGVDRYEAMRRIGGANGNWPDPLDNGASRAMFWHHMAMAARGMW